MIEKIRVKVDNTCITGAMKLERAQPPCPASHQDKVCATPGTSARKDIGDVWMVFFLAATWCNPVVDFIVSFNMHAHEKGEVEMEFGNGSTAPLGILVKSEGRYGSLVHCPSETDKVTNFLCLWRNHSVP